MHETQPKFLRVLINMNTKSFIERAQKIHCDKFSYDQTVFTNWKAPLVIKCSIHGPFKQWPEVHLRGGGCKRCKLKQAKAQKIFIAAGSFEIRAKAIHGNKYDYSTVIYTRSNQNVSIVCPKHGVFKQSPSNHLSGRGCRKCGWEERSRVEKHKFRNRTQLLDNTAYIAHAKKIHGERYDYSDLHFVDSKTKVRILCQKHGLFTQDPLRHLSGSGCKACADKIKGEKKRNKAAEEFSQRAIEIHGNKYDYSKTVYSNNSCKVEIFCKKHGPFYIRPNSHLNGSGCKACGIERRSAKQATSLEKFINQAREIHQNRYDYSEVVYARTHQPVTIICSNHGSFSQAPSAHIAGRGCPKCGIEKCANSIRSDLKEFISNAQIRHFKKYDYSHSVYESSNIPLSIVCPHHGMFLQKPSKHLAGHGCPSCANRDMNTKKFIQRATEVHGTKYDYSQVIYKTARSKINISCPKHGFFQQVPHHHLKGVGCALCVDLLNSQGICQIEKWLIKSGIGYEREKKFPDLRSGKTGNNFLRFDFYLPLFHALIEFDGQQHFKANERFGGDEAFQKLLSNDNFKNKWAKEKGFQLIRISHSEIKECEAKISKILKTSSNY